MVISDQNPSRPAWWQRGVIYQVYPRSFMDSNTDGIGDLHGIIQKLDYLQNLGIDAIWLSPFYPSPMADFGYDVSDYCNVHPIFGNLEIFDQLLAEAHQRGIKLIIDYVPNHTSHQHPWFLESRSSRDNPKRDWYIWRDRKPDGSLPNNWGAVFGGPAWEWDEKTGQYYFHHFLKEQPDLNWRNPEVRQAMMDVLRFWLDRGVDGFRMDVVGMILKDPDFRDNPENPNAPPDLPMDDITGRQMGLFNQDLDEVHDILAGFRALLEQYEGDRCSIGEVWYEMPRWVKYYGESGTGLHLPFNFRLIHVPWRAKAVRQSVEEMEAALPPFAWPNYVLGNHDVNRLASRIGLLQTPVAAMLLLTLRGTPTMYYGDEIGLENGIIPADKMQDPQGIRFGPSRSRDFCRTPMQWDSSPYAGFSRVEPWLPVSPDYKTRNVAEMSADRPSLLNLYRRLLALRRNTPALHTGTYRSVEASSPDCYIYLREGAGERYLIALNFSDEPIQTAISDATNGQIITSTQLDRTGPVSLSSLSLRANEGLIIKV